MRAIKKIQTIPLAVTIGFAALCVMLDLFGTAAAVSAREPVEVVNKTTGLALTVQKVPPAPALSGGRFDAGKFSPRATRNVYFEMVLGQS